MWDTWSFRLQNVFEVENVWGIVSGSIARPGNGSDQAAIDAWDAMGKAARITINLALAPPCIPLVMSATTAAAAWKALSNAYKAKGLLKAFYYRSQLSSCRFIESQLFGPQIDHLRQLRIKQTSAGLPCEDWDFAIGLLGALPESYLVIKQSILAGQTDLHKINLGSIIALIMQEEVD
ncbi:hypothetical protein M407DRAFT_4170 [Tulasnella calospora MUT 4182]|uniref:Uncharacterized protein n=1 Tax=Tulasnella calospora MUT 4182 TaxID=1051891 RepID=A0A0C3QWH0_9AGAM|nr:hypothetical protein M407DRAFT_4170 [Tulasnella calospora MUT 4182]